MPVSKSRDKKRSASQKGGPAKRKSTAREKPSSKAKPKASKTENAAQDAAESDAPKDPLAAQPPEPLEPAAPAEPDTREAPPLIDDSLTGLQKTDWRVTAAVLLFGVLLYVPFAGSYGLWDPWETHYGEVARTMLQRNDYITTYWQDEVFKSKPVLTFWMQAGGMALFGLNKDGAPSGEMALSTLPEWGMRLPFVLVSIFCLFALYLLVARMVSKRAGVLTAVICATMPQYALVSRQSITDIPFVALMSAGLIVLHLLIYKELVRRGIRKALAKALGSDQSIPSEYELDDDGLAFRQLGNEVRFSWANVVEVNDRKNAVEIVVKPTAIAIIPKRIFDGADDLQKWIKFIEDRRELNNREDENTVT